MRALIKKNYRGNMFGGVKITLIICLTIITSCVLFISYNEYSNRYALVSTKDDGIYIFDKKSAVLNKCDGKTCSIIETKLPSKTILNQELGFQQSRLFENEKPMVKAMLVSNDPAPEKASNTDEKAVDKSTPKEDDKKQPDDKKSEDSKPTESKNKSSDKDDKSDKANTESKEKADSKKSDATDANKSTDQNNEEFVE